MNDKNAVRLIRNSTVEFLIFTGQAGEQSIEARYEDETVWLSQKLMAELRSAPQKSDRCDSYSTRRGEHTCPSERIMPRLSRPEWP